MPRTAFVPLRTRRFLLRVLAEGDVTQTYLGWFSDVAVAKYIESARVPQSEASLRAFVRDKRAGADRVLLGIFARASRRHVGNIKFEPVDRRAGNAVMGVLIGDPQWRGRGLFQEVFAACARRLHAAHGVRRFGLGVRRANAAAVRAYVKSGFRPVAGPLPSFLGRRRAGITYLIRTGPQ